MLFRSPGASNAMVGVHTAYQDSTPMVLLIGQVGTDMVEREAFQEIDYRRMYSECAKWVGSIDRVDRIDEFVSHAFHIAQAGRKGPVVLALPEDVLCLSGVEHPVAPAHIVQPGLDDKAFEQAMQVFANAKRPMIVAGGGNWNRAACDMLSAWANREGIPVATSFRSQDLLDNLDPIFAGDLGIGANPVLVKRIQEADVLLVIGERLGEMTTAGYSLLSVPKAKNILIHVHSGSEELGRVYRPDYALNCSPENFCAALSAVKMGGNHDCNSGKEAHAEYLDFADPVTVPGNLQLAQIMASLVKSIPRDSIVTNGAGNFATWVHRFYPYGPFKAGDGKTVMLGLQNEREWVQFCETVLENPALAKDERFDRNFKRNEKRTELLEIINTCFSKLTSAQLIARLDKAQIANAHLNDMEGLWKHEQLKARDRFTQVATPNGPIAALLPPGLNDSYDYRMDPIPAVGEHTDAILKELGLEDSAIANMRASGAI